MSSDYSVWGVNPKLAERTVNKIRMKHGMFASVPLICKGKRCPYIDVCSLEEDELIVGTRCPMEAGAIVERFKSWCEHFAIDTEGEFIKSEDLADVSLIKDLVENEIQIIRAENKIALSGDFLALTIVDVDKRCDEHTEFTVSPEVKFKMELQDKRYKIMQLLNATRKDKMKEKNLDNTEGSKGLAIFNKINEQLANLNSSINKE